MYNVHASGKYSSSGQDAVWLNAKMNLSLEIQIYGNLPLSEWKDNDGLINHIHTTFVYLQRKMTQ